MVEWFHKKTELPAVHARFFSTYGPAQDYKRDIPPVVSIFLSNLYNKKESVLFLRGKKQRDYIYVSDKKNNNPLLLKYLSFLLL